MGAEIDRLEVAVEASAGKANTELNKLINRLEKVADSLQNINSSGLTGFANGIEKLGKSMQTVNVVKTSDFTRLANGLDKLVGVNVEGISDTSRAISILVENLSQIGTVAVDGQVLENLANAISKFGYKNIEQATSNISQLTQPLADFITKINGLQAVTFDVAGLSNLILNISKLGGKMATVAATNLPNISRDLKAFINELNDIGTINFDVTGMANLVSSITKLGGKASKNAIPNIQALGVVLKQLMTTLATAPKVSGNVIALTNALANLASNGNRASVATEKLSRGLNLVSSSAKATKGVTSGLVFAFGRLYAIYLLLQRGFDQLKKAIDISSELTEIQNVVDVTFGNFKSKIEDFASTSITDFGMSELTAKQISSRFQAMGTAMGFSQGKMADMSVELTKLAADMSSFYNEEQDVVAKSLQSIFTGETEPLRKYGLDLTQATLKEWAMKEGLDANIQSMSQAEKTMLRYQYVLAHTGAAQGDFARTSGTWANQVRILSQQLQALASVIGGVFINALKPFVTALNNVMAKVIQFAQTVANALGSIFGWTIEIDSGGMTNDFSDIADSTGDTAGNLGDAANAAKKLKSYVLGIDELNIISPEDETYAIGGNGSGVDASGAGGAGNANLVKVESALDKYKSEIENLYQLGEYIGQALTNAMNSIKWDEVYAGARDFGTGLADFLNGLISPELFGATGRTIAGSLNTAIYAALSFGETFDWEDYGNSIAEGINEFFSTFDFGALAETINTWVKGIADTIGTAIDDIDWKKVASGICDFFSNLEIDTVTLAIGAFALKYAGKQLTSEAFKTAITGKLLSLLSGGFSITLQTLFINIVGFGFIANPIAFNEAANELLDSISRSIDTLLPDWAYDLLSKMGAGLVMGVVGGAFAGPGGMIAGGIIGAVAGAIWSLWDEIVAWWDSNIEPWWNENVAPLFTKEKWLELFGNIQSSFSQKWNEIVDWWNNSAIVVWWEDNVVPWFSVETWTTMLDNVKESFSQKWNETKEQWIKNITTWWNDNVAPWFTMKRWLTMLDNIKQSFWQKWNETKEQWIKNIITWWNNHVAPWFTIERWTIMLDNIKQSFSRKWNETKEQWMKDITLWWNNNVAPWFTLERWKELLKNIAPAFKDSFKKAANGAIQMLNKVIEGLESMINRALEGLRKLARAANKIPGVDIDVGSIRVDLPRIPTFAEGGFPETGELFMARENGINEMVGRIGHKSAVANNDQITDAIRAAVVQGLNTEEQNALLREQNSLLRAILAKDMDVTLDGRSLVNMIDEARRRMGWDFQPT